MNAGEIMTIDVVTVRPDTSVAEIVQLLLRRGISAVPVVDAERRVVGLVSEGDLLRRAELGTQKRHGAWKTFFLGTATLAGEYVRSHGETAADVMTRHVICVARDTPIPEIADLMEEKRIKRVPVLDGDKLVGIVSRSNLLRAFAALPAATESPGGVDDEAIRAKLLTELGSQAWSRRAESSVMVSGGVVHLWGLVSTPEESRALQLASAAVPGVKAVENHTIVLSEEPYPIYPGSYLI